MHSNPNQVYFEKDSKEVVCESRLFSIGCNANFDPTHNPHLNPNPDHYPNSKHSPDPSWYLTLY